MQKVGKYDDHQTLVKKRKLKWFGHVSRSSSLAKINPTGHNEWKKKKRQTEEELKSGRGWTLPAQPGQLRTGQRSDVESTSIRRHYDVMYLLEILLLKIKGKFTRSCYLRHYDLLLIGQTSSHIASLFQAIMLLHQIVIRI